MILSKEVIECSKEIYESQLGQPPSSILSRLDIAVMIDKYFGKLSSPIPTEEPKKIQPTVWDSSLETFDTWIVRNITIIYQHLDKLSNSLDTTK